MVSLDSSSRFCLLVQLLLLLGTSAARAFAYYPTKSRCHRSHHRMLSAATASSVSNELGLSSQSWLRRLTNLRGGQNHEDEVLEKSASAAADEETSTLSGRKDTIMDRAAGHLSAIFVPAKSLLASIATNYGTLLEQCPIPTKSGTAGITFFLSDILAQRIEGRNKTSAKEKSSGPKLNWTRLSSATAIGIFYFGPAAHYWYETIFQILPETTLVSSKFYLGRYLKLCHTTIQSTISPSPLTVFADSLAKGGPRSADLRSCFYMRLLRIEPDASGKVLDVQLV